MPLRSPRQARFLSDRVILPQGVTPGQWYDVAQGRRHDDNQPGTVQLDLGGRRINVLASYLEFRKAPHAARRRWRAPATIAVSLLPLGVAAAVAFSLATRTR
jgi:hypothetical protein